MFEDNDLNKKQAATNREGLTRMLIYNEKILKENGLMSCHNSVLDFFKSSTVTQAITHLYSWMLEIMTQMTC